MQLTRKTYDKSFYTIFIVINVLSFFTLFVAFPAGLLVSLIILGIMFLAPVDYLGVLFRKEHLLFSLFILFEIFSIMYYFIIPISREMLREHPILPLESISYILIPQIFFYSMGTKLGEKKQLISSGIQKFLFINVCFLLFSIVLHFTRPTFFNTFLERTLGELYDYYGGAYPRMTGYLNSMIVGMLSSSGFILTLGFIDNSQRKKKIFYAVIFLLSSFLSLQRGSWVAILLGLIFITIVSFFQKPVKTLTQTTKVCFLLLFLGGLIYCFLANHGSFENAGLLSSLELELLNRISSIGEAAGERYNQFDNFIYVVNNHPFGIGMGMLSHKAAVYGFEYATPDGNYFRIIGDTGVIGGGIFLIMLIASMAMLTIKKQYTLLITLLLFSLQAYGTNVFDLYYVSFIFWTLVGISFSRTRREVAA